MKRVLLFCICVLALSACSYEVNQAVEPEITEEVSVVNTKIATLAGGCFWCVEHSLENLKGVDKVVSGYSGGHLDKPTYKQVTYEDTGHREAVQVHYDPSIISYEDILRRFFMIIDPTDEGGQFADRGFSYTTAIFYHDEDQKKTAEALISELQQSKYDDPIVTPLIEFTNFFDAEDYHQDYSKKNPVRYKVYSTGSGRVGYIKETWGNDAAN